MVNVDDVKKAAIRNAFTHGGKARASSVISEMLGKDRNLVKEMQELKNLADKAVEEINSLPLEKINDLAKELGIIEIKEKEKKELRPLPNVDKGVVLRLPPEPSGYMHWGHALSFMINYLYKEMYGGKLWLRFEDTNPELVRDEFVKNFEEGISWLGIKYDQKKFVSDDMPVIYEFAEKLIKSGDMYACLCSSEEIKENRETEKECIHRNQNVDENLRLWNESKSGKFKNGEITFRLKGNMQSKDAALRDPNLMRIIETKYKPYYIWPLYDFTSVIEDELCGITHILRSNEFKVTLQSALRKALGFKEPNIIQFSRFNFSGTLTSKRKVRELIKEGYIKDWDDIRLATISSMRRRGIRPEAIKKFLIDVGYSSSEHEYNIDMLLTFNRRIIDKDSKRLFFVPNPIKLIVINAPAVNAKLQFHPSNELGFREVNTNGTFFVDNDDFSTINPGDTLRLKELYSVEVVKKENEVITCKIKSLEHIEGEKIIQWVTEENVPITITKVGNLVDEEEKFNPDSLTEIKGMAEKAVNDIENDQIVQFERFGFCRMDDKEKGKMIFVSK
jgi:glutamyl-tRNA synthetase